MEPWQKVLWKPQQFEDNYVDKETFLNSLVTNANVRPFHYWTMVRASVVFIRAISGVALFTLVFNCCWNEKITAQTMLVADSTIFTVAQITSLNFDSTGMDVRRLFILLVALAGLTPVSVSYTHLTLPTIYSV
eukprot:TRINITY_DN10310_c0_g1_i1.p1 TRINITY_DN10310_c0_g1~~TRINITY_DN10310_c0_g1_i1.p1  ORF type:complete len:133 (-),score=30.16 TRINITY_DN10310_c0_g1_i1:59-457(-)